MKDRVFNKNLKKQFEFDEEVASVFDDMLSRSIPFYDEMLNLSVDFALKYLKEGDRVLDLGCSTATALIEIFRKAKISLELVGVDNSIAMIERARRKISAYNSNIELHIADILDFEFEKNQIILSNYTLQFIRPLHREALIKKIFDSLNDGGLFIFSEKVLSEDKIFNKQFIDRYYRFKKSKGYSDFEISQKREALENVLVPYSEIENRELIKRVGFSRVETLFKWVNFATFIARR